MTDKKKIRSYSIPTIKRLYASSGNQCLYPGCETQFLPDDKSNLSVICHITALAPNGPRYNSALTDKERNNYDNLILLCPTHHTKIDQNPKQYPVELLDKWKYDRANKIIYAIQEKNPLGLNILLNYILTKTDISFYDYDYDLASTLLVPITSEKIEYNKLSNDYKKRISDSKAYEGKLKAVYNEISNNGVNRPIIDKWIEEFYKTEKSKYAESEIVKNSNEILDAIFENIKNEIQNSSNKVDMTVDAIDFYLDIIITDAFRRCLILEPLPSNM